MKVDVERRKKGRVAKNFLGSKRDGLELDWLDVEECEVLYGIFNIGREGGLGCSSRSRVKVDEGLRVLMILERENRELWEVKNKGVFEMRIILHE